MNVKENKNVRYPRSTKGLLWIAELPFSLGEPEKINNTSRIDHDWKNLEYVVYPRSAQALHWMPGLQPGWTRKDTQQFPILTMNEKLSMFYIPEALTALHWMPGLQYGWTRKDRQHFPRIDNEWKAKYVIYPRSAQALLWMPGLQPGWTRKDRQHFPTLTMNKKLSMLYIPEVLRHYTECQDFSLGEPERIDNTSLYWPWMKS